MTHRHTELHHVSRPLVWSGFKQLAPISVLVTAFGVAFGLAAAQTGLHDSTIMMMSALVFAGAAQFAALELWGAQIPLLTMIITVFAINARHLLMGATLYPWLRHQPPLKRYGMMLVASDANWAMSMQEFSRGKPGLGLLFGGGIALWLFWVLGTWLGMHFGNAINDPKSFGLDMVMGCFFLALIVGGEKDVRMLFIWVVAAASSSLAYWYLPDNSHVIVGALAGGIVGTVWGGEQDSGH
ncbi:MULTISPECIES: AzlC family ABC transporter permease [unclassified Oceanobacter]|uniref:AzlC family ABC transporter permease n=1 Tax=unclassified Oceanobacter TaxID=2620260 RepID=UPI0026E40D21|nr:MULTISPECIES: AzlC family ABC transporter permease [unclassified Oceanobacter]MDO6681423.1 AzlC family ABC transporter permease [Oceanobacter sp. 5_MG-2023]MDP2505131.1 AzlC family ABC transporter permease [Oceanobacter sp. 3_MG-2023]MDP2548255.1 AzlC family ABC transporter permease [Oceanobacter sp. 4_MG-2023]MDP2608889.1 AzlC family ABC transporter permease [Oceanobacter sp. 1_MG-2023]MDP2611869.1 AzlC family ABC transporter permease [Oceanobacter sp. 2_MG-2023]